MKPLRPYRISVYNLAAHRTLGAFYSNQVPSPGDLVTFFGFREEGDPFSGWCMWKVDRIAWHTSQSGSMTARRLSAESEVSEDHVAFCTSVEMLVWPSQGPHYVDTPAWAKAASAPGYHEGEE